MESSGLDRTPDDHTCLSLTGLPVVKQTKGSTRAKVTELARGASRDALESDSALAHPLWVILPSP
jgi:hypothetical protein